MEKPIAGITALPLRVARDLLHAMLIDKTSHTQRLMILFGAQGDTDRVGQQVITSL